MTAEYLLYALVGSLVVNFFAIREAFVQTRENKKLIRRLRESLLQHVSLVVQDGTGIIDIAQEGTIEFDGKDKWIIRDGKRVKHGKKK